jgi:phosphoserine phosphatase
VTKGAVDALLPRCSHGLEGGRIVRLDESHRDEMLRANETFGSDGMRVLAVAVRPLETPPPDPHPEHLERDLVLLGLVALIDPPRAEAAEAVAVCRRAGIRPVMITGDHPVTARRIAADLGICRHDARVVTGVELERMSSADLGAIVNDVGVYARVSPEHKLKIIEALQARGHVVAMTGDGVNDAPALKRADIGVAMGSGTDVAKEAADMVLLDDNFATIVAAVEEGRVVYDNIRRFVQFPVAGNFGKVLTVAVPPFLGLPLLLLPVQILFSNLLTDGLLGLGMGVEKAERNTMRRPPYDPDEGVFSRGMGINVAWLGSFIGVITIGVGAWAYIEVTHDGVLSSADAAYVSTLVFTTLALMQLGRVQATRSFRDPVFTMNPFGNPTLLAMVAIAFALQMIAIYLPAVQPFFHTDWVLRSVSRPVRSCCSQPSWRRRSDVGSMPGTGLSRICRSHRPLRRKTGVAVRPGATERSRHISTEPSVFPVSRGENASEGAELIVLRGTRLSSSVDDGGARHRSRHDREEPPGAPPRHTARLPVVRMPSGRAGGISNAEPFRRRRPLFIFECPHPGGDNAAQRFIARVPEPRLIRIKGKEAGAPQGRTGQRERTTP